jgi:hypothetical protein
MSEAGFTGFKDLQDCDSPRGEVAKIFQENEDK